MKVLGSTVQAKGFSFQKCSKVSLLQCCSYCWTGEEQTVLFMVSVRLHQGKLII